MFSFSDVLEFGTQLAKIEESQIKTMCLHKKSSKELKRFNLLDEDILKGIKLSQAVSKFDMSRLEVEYDYETESEQIKQSKSMLQDDLNDAIEFFVNSDPLRLI